jgi:ferric-dicitrate binding protein FerR (iron transport regulator)
MLCLNAAERTRRFNRRMTVDPGDTESKQALQSHDETPSDDSSHTRQGTSRQANVTRTRTIVIVALFVAILLCAALAAQLRDLTQSTASRNSAKGEAISTSHTLIPLADGKTCRETVLDSASSEVLTSKIRPCVLPRPPAEPLVDWAAEIQAQRRKSFSWGRN